MPHTIRPARLEDVPAMLALAEERRARYEQYQPVFWRRAADAREKQQPFFERLVGSDASIVSVHERQDGVVDGFIIAQFVQAPAVYAPGGLTCSIDDFWVAGGHEWRDVGEALLAAVTAEALARGATQTVVVCGHRDDPKRALLAALGYSIASEWYVKAL